VTSGSVYGNAGSGMRERMVRKRTEKMRCVRVHARSRACVVYICSGWQTPRIDNSEPTLTCKCKPRLCSTRSSNMNGASGANGAFCFVFHSDHALVCVIIKASITTTTSLWTALALIVRGDGAPKRRRIYACTPQEINFWELAPESLDKNRTLCRVHKVFPWKNATIRAVQQRSARLLQVRNDSNLMDFFRTLPGASDVGKRSPRPRRAGGKTPPISPWVAYRATSTNSESTGDAESSSFRTPWQSSGCRYKLSGR